MGAGLEIQIENLSGASVALAPLLRVLKKAARAEKFTRGHWQITIVRDAAMKKLHKQTMNLPTTTDVLTFDMRDADASPRLLDLDTVVCADVAGREARRRGHSVGDELLLYMVHSLLHVSGHDDLEPAAAAKMHAREDQLLKLVGVGAVYTRAEKASRRRKVRA